MIPCRYPAVFVLLIFSLQSYAQNYEPFKDIQEQLVSWEKITFQRFTKDSLNAQGEFKKDLQKQYRQRYEGIKEIFTEKGSVSDPEANNYFQQIAKKIIDNNPELRSLEPRIYFARSAVPNAYSCGEGSIFFNSGLFTHLKNESQVAFVLCHELAHYYLDHGNKRIIENVNTINSKELKKELKKISKSEYQQNKKFGELVTSFLFKNSRYTRMQESAADSIGLHFFINTGFEAAEVLETMNRLDSTEVENIEMAAVLKKWFSFPEHPFKESWIKKTAAFFGGPVSSITDAQKDSLKTHPDCAVRKKALEPKVSGIMGKGKTFQVNEPLFQRVSFRSKYDLIETLLKEESISACLYFSLQLLEEYPEDPWIIGTIGECFNLLYKHQKAHTLGTIVSLPNPEGLPQYNVLLEFIQRARLDDFAAISKYFLQKNKGTATNERLQKALDNNRSLN